MRGWPTDARRQPGEIRHELLLLDDDDSCRINRIVCLNDGAAPGDLSLGRAVRKRQEARGRI
jgi:hypothetical protein